MPARSSRNRNAQKKQTENGKLYIQIILSIVFICSFMIFKDAQLPNGKTPHDYAKQILTTTVNLPEVIAHFSEDTALPAGADIFKP